MYFSNVASKPGDSVINHLPHHLRRFEKAPQADPTQPTSTKVKIVMAKSKKLDALNETGQRKGGDRRQKKSKAEAEAAKPVVERRKAKRRRQIDPTTCEREYSEMEIEFMQAMDEYKRASGRMLPTCSEILEVLVKLGYRKIADPQAIYDPEENNTTSDQLETIED